MRRLSAAQSARRQEQKQYLYRVASGDRHVRYLSAKGLQQAYKQFNQYAKSKGGSVVQGDYLGQMAYQLEDGSILELKRV